jgi:hypothetical protein
MLMIAWWKDDKCDTVHAIPWITFRDSIIIALQSRVKGNYKGKSLRLYTDADLIEPYALRKEKRRWVIPSSHWLYVYTKR